MGFFDELQRQRTTTPRPRRAETDDGEGGDTGGNTGGNIMARNIRLTIPMHEVEKAFRMIHQKTGCEDLEQGMEIIWHKKLDVDELARAGLVVTILRCHCQGDVLPPRLQPF
ncbi:MAG: hypothetical protein OHK006_13900 [Thermodesulfovibrionales bacterium]